MSVDTSQYNRVIFQFFEDLDDLEGVLASSDIARDLFPLSALGIARCLRASSFSLARVSLHEVGLTKIKIIGLGIELKSETHKLLKRCVLVFLFNYRFFPILL